MRYLVLFCHFPTDKGYNVLGKNGKAKIFQSIEQANNGILSVIAKNKLKRENCDWVIFKEIEESEYNNL